MTGPIAIFGAGGQVGRETTRLARARGIDVAALKREDADITDIEALRRALDRCAPRLIVNVAAYTAVDKAESDIDGAMASNVTGPALLAAEAQARGVPILHFSTDYVFDGSKTGAYSNEIILERQNFFKGWECSIGDSIWIDQIGQVSMGTCGQIKVLGNILWDALEIGPKKIICKKDHCHCGTDILIPKKKIIKIKKVKV